MPPPPPDRRPPFVVGIEWASRITSLAMEMVVPALLGYWGDQTWGTAPWCVIGGAIVGMLTAGVHFKQIADELSKRSPPSSKS